MTYLIYHDGQQYGPYTLDDVKQYCAQGRIAQSDFAWAEGLPEWITVGKLLAMPSPPGESQATTASCPKCSSPAGPSDVFCNSCGAPLQPSVAPRPPKPNEPAAAPHPGHIKFVAIALSVVAVIVLIVLFVRSGPKPDTSLDAARQAYLQHDQANFDKYVDVSSVLGDWADQGLENYLDQDHAGFTQRLALESALQAAKGVYLPEISQSVDNFVVNGTLPADSQGNNGSIGSQILAGFLSSAMRKLASSQLSYEGVASETVSGKNAFLNVKVGVPIKSDPVIVKIKMQRDGDHWRVVAIQDIEGLLKQLT